jgi:hypothetical protein
MLAKAQQVILDFPRGRPVKSDEWPRRAGREVYWQQLNYLGSRNETRCAGSSGYNRPLLGCAAAQTSAVTCAKDNCYDQGSHDFCYLD